MSNSYLLYQLYEKRGDQPFHPAYPVSYSVDGDGTMQKILKMEDDPNCNSVDNTIYQWVEVTGEYECSGTTKCQKEKEQRSDDFGVTWTDTGNYRPGTPIEYNSEYCGWQPPQYRTVSGEPYCNGYTKMFDIWNQVSYDGGTTWENTGVSGSTVLAYDSPECGYPIYQWVDTDNYICVEGSDAQYRTVSGTPYCDGYDLYVDTQEQISPDGGETWQDYGEPSTILVEKDSMRCGFIPEKEYRWVDIPINEDYDCVGVDKYYKEKEQESVDKGQTWVDTGEVRRGQLYEYNSVDCGYNGHYTSEYLTFEVISSDMINTKNIAISRPYGGNNITVKYQVNNDAWVTEILSGDPITIYGLTNGDKVRLSTNYSNIRISGTASFDVSGNLLSVGYGDNFNDGTPKAGKSYWYMFKGTNVVNARNLVMPSNLYADDFLEMFYGCSSLVSAPKLPATTLTVGCYNYMFYNCRNLTTVPRNMLPATTMQNRCYASMFYNCQSLQTAPTLPAPTLVNDCYRFMLTNCASLNYIKCLATDISASGCTHEWLKGVSSTGVFYKPLSMNGWTTGISGIPSGWTVQNASS